jgi:hypothetical protein
MKLCNNRFNVSFEKLSIIQVKITCRTMKFPWLLQRAPSITFKPIALQSGMIKFELLMTGPISWLSTFLCPELGTEKSSLETYYLLGRDHRHRYLWLPVRTQKVHDERTNGQLTMCLYKEHLRRRNHVAPSMRKPQATDTFRQAGFAVGSKMTLKVAAGNARSSSWLVAKRLV